jgi:hypothetical protein
MLKSKIKPKTEYAFRAKRKLDCPVEKIRVLEHIRGNKWKVEWIDPNPGLVHYVESQQLLAPWKEHKAYLREEAEAERLRAYNKEHGYEPDSPLDNAVSQVFESVGEQVSYYRGSLYGPPDAIERIRQRASFTTSQLPPGAYTDRNAIPHLPFDHCLELAKKFCAAEPAAVLVGVESTEREWSRNANRGDEYLVPLLNQYRASWALIRQWTGYEPAVAQREAEIQKLERLVWDAIYTLQKAGLDKEATRLRRAVEKR